MYQAGKERVIIVFADVRGSSRWTRRMADEEDVRHHFWMNYDEESLFYVKRTAAPYYKRLGDGRMFVHEMGRSDASELASIVLTESLGLTHRIHRLIAKLPSPRPGFRIRLMSGTVSYERYPDGEKDWIGYVPNSCHKFLSVFPEIPCLVQETVKELIRPADVRRNGFSFALALGDRRHPDGVDLEDLQALWTVNQKSTVTLA